MSPLEKALGDKGYEVIVLEHNAGHSVPPAEVKDAFAWIQAVIDGKEDDARDPAPR